MKIILLIEAAPGVREATAEILALAGYRVVQAADGQHGVALARTAGPDLVLCNPALPRLDGYGVLRILHQDPATAGLPFLFLAAEGAGADVRRGMSAGADDYLTAPLDDAALLDAVALRLARCAARAPGPPAAGRPGMALLHDRLAAGLRPYKKKHVLYREGDAPPGLYWLQRGAAKTYKADAAGNAYLTELSGDGQFLGYLAVLGATDYAETTVLLENATVGLLPLAEFLALLEQFADVARHFLQLLARAAAVREARLLELAYQPVRRRLSLALVQCEQVFQPLGRRGRGTSIPREDLAALVGASKETISRMLSSFRAEGLVETDGSAITILDAARLRRQQR
ncbi:MAG: response regulator [Janthinobacterium lividum]